METKILLIGRNPTVLAQLKAALTAERYWVETTSRVEQAADEFETMHFDLIAFGRGVDEQMNEQLRSRFLARQSQVLFVNGLAPIISLLVKQIQLALAGNQTPGSLTAQVNDWNNNELSVSVTITSAGRVTITRYELDAVHHTRQQTLVSRPMPAGTHQIVLNALRPAGLSLQFLAFELDSRDLLVVPLP